MKEIKLETLNLISTTKLWDKLSSLLNKKVYYTEPSKRWNLKDKHFSLLVHKYVQHWAKLALDKNESY
jgi:hypothetical protein